MWTPTELESEFCKYEGRVWRIVEGQHKISTNRLADIEDQGRLEELIEEIKPDLPQAAADLHFLLGSCFRYGYEKESRFRRAHELPGIFYAGESQETVLAELAWWRLDFISKSPGMIRPSGQSEHTSFTVGISIDRLIDLTKEPLVKDREQWLKDDYTACQNLATAARELDSQAIRYESARDRSGAGRNIAILDPTVFTDKPKFEMTWSFRYDGEYLVASSAFPDSRILRFNFRD